MNPTTVKVPTSLEVHDAIRSAADLVRILRTTEAVDGVLTTVFDLALASGDDATGEHIADLADTYLPASWGPNDLIDPLQAGKVGHGLLRLADHLRDQATAEHDARLAEEVANEIAWHGSAEPLPVEPVTVEEVLDLVSGDPWFGITREPTQPTPRMPDDVDDDHGTDVYDLGTWEAMTIGLALEGLANDPEGTPSEATAIRALARVFGQEGRFRVIHYSPED